jgi:leucyl-tRNA synthetase
MDTFIDSSWYFMRYCSPDSDTAMVDARTAYWMPMDQYIGGIEHAVLHLLYARFWTKVMRDLGLVEFGEPFSNLLTQGMVLNETYFREDASGRRQWFNPADVEVSFDDKGRPLSARLRSDGEPVEIGGTEKMSKSKNNGIDPQAIIDRYGADTARLFTMFASPPEQTLEWSDSGVEGAHRFLKRLFSLASQHDHWLKVQASKALQRVQADTDEARDLRRQMHELLRQADFDLARRQYNTVVSACMKMLNLLDEFSKRHNSALPDSVQPAFAEGLGILLRMLYPVVPHLTYQLWKSTGFESAHASLLNAPWPQVDESACVRNTLELMLQVNGKLRGSLQVPADASREAIEAAALASEAFAKFSEGRPAKKVVVVPGRLVNLVV